MQQGNRRSLLIENAKVPVVDHQEKVTEATAAAVEAESAARSVESALNEQEELLKRHQAEIRREAEAVMLEEREGRGDSFVEEMEQIIIESESGFPEVGEIKKRISVMQAKLSGLKLVLDEKNAALDAATAAFESAQAELLQLEEEEKEKNAELPPLASYYLGQELKTVAELLKQHEEAQAGHLEAARQRREMWVKERAHLQEELHQVGMTVESAKADLEKTKQIPKSIKKSLKH